MDLLQIGQQYSAVQLAHMWGYKSHHPLVKGMVTPSGMNIVILQRVSSYTLYLLW